jgi:hypothetical protein
MAFDKCKEYFPWLDTKQKMLDYVFNTKLDIPEVMKGQNIEWVYCDVDGTLLIWWEQEETQILNKKVVSMLKWHETEWKQITIWTWWDLEKAQTLLKSLWIDWPVVSKYDYAGAIAEIVVDNEDEWAFVLQYKIAPKTFINANNI